MKTDTLIFFAYFLEYVLLFLVYARMDILLQKIVPA